MREKSKHLVTVFDISNLRDKTIAFLKERDSFPEGCRLDIGFGIGVVEKKGEHYLINTEGVGRKTPFDVKPDEIYWYKSYFDKKSKMTGFDCMHCAETKLTYPELLAECTVVKQISLDEYIRTFGARLEQNYEIWDMFLSR